MWNDAVKTMNATVVETFGQPVTYIRKDDKIARNIHAVLKISHYLDNSSGDTLTNIQIKALDVRVSDLDDHQPTFGDHVVIKGMAYSVTDVFQSTSDLIKVTLNKESHHL
ncbi:head-tail joining protein [Bartonella sp. CB60]|uniref:head-tail joining protein n=1 Tax=Bartonella sp. CB60 TaxID=3113619 RepID=UPI00300E0A8B